MTLEDDADNFVELKYTLSVALTREGIRNYPFEIERDVMVYGPLSEIMEFCQNWRSEIEELG